uniref:Uncharacterized protein n=1 Tax=Rhizophora mucronata TaxID=61149 RepID=A0A2P2IKY9_RHIMU
MFLLVREGLQEHVWDSNMKHELGLSHLNT